MQEKFKKHPSGRDYCHYDLWFDRTGLLKISTSLSDYHIDRYFEQSCSVKPEVMNAMICKKSEL